MSDKIQTPVCGMVYFEIYPGETREQFEGRRRQDRDVFILVEPSYDNNVPAEIRVAELVTDNQTIRNRVTNLEQDNTRLIEQNKDLLRRISASATRNAELRNRIETMELRLMLKDVENGK